VVAERHRVAEAAPPGDVVDGLVGFLKQPPGEQNPLPASQRAAGG